jgi:hypothetical protein
VGAHGLEQFAGKAGHGLDQAAYEGEFRFPVRERSRPHRWAEQDQRAWVAAGGKTGPRVQASPLLLPLLRAGCAHIATLGLVPLMAVGVTGLEAPALSGWADCVSWPGQVW